MIGHQYGKGEVVLVDPGVFTASPTRSEPTIECIVEEWSPGNASQVYVRRLGNFDMLYVFKDRVRP